MLPEHQIMGNESFLHSYLLNATRVGKKFITFFPLIETKHVEAILNDYSK